jgi:hypothetical protein
LFLLQKYGMHLPIFDEQKQHIIDPVDEYIIDLDIDIIQDIDKKKSMFNQINYSLL